jgi:hypothetical protein
MRYSPRAENRGAKALMLLFFALSILCFSFTIPLPAYRGLWTSCASVFFMGGVFLYARYIGTSFTYEIALRGYPPAEDGMEYTAASPANVAALPPHMLDFTVRKTQGRRSVTDARLGLGELAYFDLYPCQGGKEREVHKTYPDMKIFNYTASMIPERAYIAVFADGDGGTVGLILEPDTAMASYLSRVAGMQ